MRNTFLLTLIFFLIYNNLSAQPLEKGQAVVTFNVGPYAAKVIDVRYNSLACTGTNWDATYCPPGAPLIQPPNWTTARMGAIFGVAIDGDNGDMFFAASPLLVDLTIPVTVSNVGIIFKAKGSNFALSDFIVNNNTYGSYLGTNQISNQKEGLGDVAYDPLNDQLFATNLLDGKIYRITGLNNPTGTVVSVYDPFATDAGNATYPVAALQRCWGVGVNRDNDGKVRVYFAREIGLTGQSEIWSVELDGAGEFVGGTETFEFNGPNPGVRITDLAFKPGDRMLLAERSGAHNSETWEAVGTHLAWILAKHLEVGEYTLWGSSDRDNTAGGVDYGYKQFAGDPDNLGECGELIWATSNAARLDALAIYGLSGIPAGGYVGPYLSNAYMVDFDGSVVGGPYVKGDLGDVEIYRDPCDTRDICGSVGAFAKPENDPAAGECCWKFSLLNEYEDNYFSGVQFIGLDGVQLSYSGVLPTWDVVHHTPSEVIISPHGGASIPKDNFPDILQLCLNGYTTTPQKIVVQWLGPLPNQTVVCSDTIEVGCPVPGGNPRCVRAVNDSLFCKDGKYTYTFDIKNNAPFNVQSFVITPLDSNIQVHPALTNLPFPGIPSGGTGGTYTVTLTGSGLVPGNPFCFYLTAHDIPITNGNFPHECCTDSVVVDCLPIPNCDPCDGVTFYPDMLSPNPNGGCCVSLTVENNYYPGFFTGIQVAGVGGVQLSYASGWAILPPVLPSSVTFVPPGGTLDTGIVTFAQICLNGFTTAPQYFVVNMLGPDGAIVCSDTFQTECPPPPPPTCAIATNDSLWCQGGQVKYTFSIKNSPLNTFDIESFNLVLADTGFNVSQTYFVLGTPLPPGNEAGPFTIDMWGSSALAGNPFCFIISAHDGVWDSIPANWPRTCCTDSVNVRCLIIPDCSGQDSCCTQCCTGSDLKLPNGFSPNGDGANDTYKIVKLTPAKNCGKINLTIYNRWGNVVWEHDDYQNQWDGTNQNGVSLPEGTYYVLMKIESTGLTLTNFVELRR